jgi:hypothetical protein
MNKWDAVVALVVGAIILGALEAPGWGWCLFLAALIAL